MKNKYCPMNHGETTLLNGCVCCNALNLQREDMEKELVNYVDEKVKEKHKTCLTDQFDNGQFWAYKDIQQKLIKFSEGSAGEEEKE